MATSSKINYTPRKYLVKFGWSSKIFHLLLCYNVNHEYCFVDLESGKIFNLTFSTVDEAEKWLYQTTEVQNKSFN